MQAPFLPPSWTGWYIGIQGGVVGHDAEYRDLNGFLDGSAGAPPHTYSASDTGGIVGGHAGYNWQAGALVFGIEADISRLWAKVSALAEAPAEPGGRVSFDIDWLATVRGRFGAVIGQAALLYVTGGVAFGHVENSAALAPIFNPSQMASDDTKTGWTIGGGIEYRITHNWTVRAEGRYVDLGDSTATCSPAGITNCAFSYRGDFSNTLLMGLVGASLRF